MNYQKIEPDDFNNGPGIRVSIWVSGCSNNCPGCFNKEAQNPNSGIPFTEETQQHILDLLSREHIAGITFLGGDPLYIGNKEEVLKFAKRIKEKFGNTKTVWLWTGYLWENIKKIKNIEFCDVVVDGPFIENLKDSELLYSGSSNQRVIDVKETFKTGCIVTLKNKR